MTGALISRRDSGPGSLHLSVIDSQSRNLTPKMFLRMKTSGINIYNMPQVQTSWKICNLSLSWIKYHPRNLLTTRTKIMTGALISKRDSGSGNQDLSLIDSPFRNQTPQMILSMKTWKMNPFRMPGAQTSWITCRPGNLSLTEINRHPRILLTKASPTFKALITKAAG